MSFGRTCFLAQRKDEANLELEERLLSAQEDNVLEMDEIWSYILRKVDRCWLWIDLCRRTRQIVAFVFGDQSEA